MSTIFSWHEKEENILYSSSKKQKYIYKVRIVLSTQYKYVITLQSMSIGLLSHYNLTLGLLSQLFYFFDDYFTSKNIRPFPLQLIFEHKSALTSMINLFLVTGLFENLITFMKHFLKMFTQTFVWSLRSLPSTLPSQGHLCVPDYELISDSHRLSQFYFYDNLYGR